VTEGLIVMVCALAATAYLAFDAVATAPAEMRRRLSIVAAVNAGLAVAGIVVIVARLT
jgi:hypothetical protein